LFEDDLEMKEENRREVKNAIIEFAEASLSRVEFTVEELNKSFSISQYILSRRGFTVIQDTEKFGNEDGYASLSRNSSNNCKG
jgi:hypothetical protein